MIRLRWISSRSNWTAAAALADATSDASTVAEDFALAAKQDDAPAALHPAGELGGAVFLAGAAGRHGGTIAPALPRIEPSAAPWAKTELHSAPQRMRNAFPGRG